MSGRCAAPLPPPGRTHAHAALRPGPSSATDPSHRSSPIEDESHALAVDVAKGLGVDIGDPSLDALTVPGPSHGSTEPFSYNQTDLADAMQRLGLAEPAQGPSEGGHNSAASTTTPAPPAIATATAPSPSTQAPSPSAWTTPDLTTAPGGAPSGGPTAGGGFVTMTNFAPVSQTSAPRADSSSPHSSSPAAGAATPAAAAHSEGAPLPPRAAYAPYPVQAPAARPGAAAVPSTAAAGSPPAPGMVPVHAGMSGPAGGGMMLFNGMPMPMPVPGMVAVPMMADGTFMPYAPFAAMQPGPGGMGPQRGMVQAVPGMAQAQVGVQQRQQGPGATQRPAGPGGVGGPAFTNAAAGPRSALASGGLHPGPQVLGPGPPIQTGEKVKGPDGANVFIFHIPSTMTNQDLYALFEPYGDVISARIMVDPATGRSRGFGFVSYETADQAQASIDSMNGYQLGRKRLKVQVKKERSEAQDPAYGAGSRGRGRDGPRRGGRGGGRGGRGPRAGSRTPPGGDGEQSPGAQVEVDHQ